MRKTISNEHTWLRQFLGTWQYESISTLPDGSVLKGTGTEVVRPLGDLWILAELHATLSGAEDPISCALMLGYDSMNEAFVGSWAGSPMSNLFIYRGALDEQQRFLCLNSTGPNVHDSSTKSVYQDVIELKSPSTRVQTSRMKQPDGSWYELMVATYTRIEPGEAL